VKDTKEERKRSRQQPQEKEMSRFQKLFQKNDGTAATNNEVTEQTTKEEEDAAKEEAKVSKIFEICRDYFLLERLNGNVTVSSSFLAFGNDVSSDIDGTSEEAQAELAQLSTEKMNLEEKELGTFEKIACNAAKKALKNLENRALAYRNKSYKGGLTLSSSVGVTTPGLSVVSFSISISASVDSLLESHARKQQK
jgi:hypothetical protein